jgi:hypothetical protein
MANNTRITLFFYLHLALIAFYSCCVVYPHLGLKIDVLAIAISDQPVSYCTYSKLTPPLILASNSY